MDEYNRAKDITIMNKKRFTTKNIVHLADSVKNEDDSNK